MISRRWKSARTRSAIALYGAASSSSPRYPKASARVERVLKCSVTVQALHRRSRMAGSTGWRESFQSP